MTGRARTEPRGREGSVRGRLRRRRVAELADRQRLRTGLWFDRDRCFQHCPACGTPVSIPDPAGSDEPNQSRRYADAVEHGLSDAVFDHLMLDRCPTPERAL